MVLAPIGIALFLVFSSVTVLKAWAGQSRATHDSQGTNDLSWIDKTIGPDADAAFLLTPDFQADPHPLWQSEFWNRSVRRVFLLDAFDPTGYPAIPTTLNRAGRLVTAPGTRQPKYVVTAPGVDVDGKLLASTPRLALYRVSSPLRLADRSSGLTADGWTGADATYTRYHPGAKVVIVDLSRPALPVAPGRVRVELVSNGSTVARRAWIARSDSEKTFRFRAPRLRSRCESTSRRPSRLRSSGSPTRASSACARRSGRCRGDEQGANAARQGPPPDQPDLLDGRGARRYRRALGRGRAREGRERGLAGPLLAVVHAHRTAHQPGHRRRPAVLADFTKRRFFPKPAESRSASVVATGSSSGCAEHGSRDHFDRLRHLTRGGCASPVEEAEKAGFGDRIDYAAAISTRRARARPLRRGLRHPDAPPHRGARAPARRDSRSLTPDGLSSSTSTSAPYASSSRTSGCP